jgi:hypothetical protein
MAANRWTCGPAWLDGNGAAFGDADAFAAGRDAALGLDAAFGAARVFDRDFALRRGLADGLAFRALVFFFLVLGFALSLDFRMAAAFADRVLRDAGLLLDFRFAGDAITRCR